MLTAILLGIAWVVLPGLAVGALPWTLPRRWPAAARIAGWLAATAMLVFFGLLPSVAIAIAFPLLTGAFRPRGAANVDESGT